MNLRRTFFLSLALILASAGAATRAQTGKPYQQMTGDERSAFVGAEARRIARQISGNDYEFTQAFEAEIQRMVEQYAWRIGNNKGDRPGKGDARLVFERGREVAPTLISAFRAQGVSPLIGLYIPLVESEYINLQSPNPVGAVGMFQFLPKTGQNYGLTEQDLLDVEKSATAAARLIQDGIKQFNSDPMKEALALLAYNRGGSKTAEALRLVLNAQNKGCSICALTAASSQLDQTFQQENVYYVPRFFAAAIVGENPHAFGLSQQPLSSYEAKP